MESEAQEEKFVILQLKTKLEESIKGIFLLSETDAPFTIVQFPLEGDIDTSLRKQLEISEATLIEEVALSDFFKLYTEPQEWDTEEDVAIKQRFTEVFSFFNEKLLESKVYRVGRIEITVYIIGIIPGLNTVLGLQSLLVET
jgi:hypothetical protein